MSDTPDFTDTPDEQLAETVAAATAEVARRQVITGAQQRTDDMCLEYLRATGRENGGPWEAPLGFLGAYPTGWRVTHDDGTFEAAAPGVVTTPPGDGWVEVDPGTVLVDFWEARAYDAGEQARDAGRVWTATSAVDGQRPSEYPGGWSAAN